MKAFSPTAPVLKETLLQKGAEADILLGAFLGRKAVFKQRKPESYRNPALDLQLRSSRTRTEALFLVRSRKAGVRSPLIYAIDLAQCTLVMEFLEGKKFRDVLQKEKRLSKAGKMLCMQFGTLIGKLHNHSLIHGDLTTSNVMVQGKALAFLDFGLSSESAALEDKAVDLLNLKKMFLATHLHAHKGWGLILDSYLRETGIPHMPEKIAEIEARARYS